MIADHSGKKSRTRQIDSKPRTSTNFLKRPREHQAKRLGSYMGIISETMNQGSRH